jgi:hypothetical protein
LAERHVAQLRIAIPHFGQCFGAEKLPAHQGVVDRNHFAGPAIQAGRRPIGRDIDLGFADPFDEAPAGEGLAGIGACILEAEWLGDVAGEQRVPAKPGHRFQHLAQHHIVTVVIGPVAAGCAGNGAGAETGQRIAATLEASIVEFGRFGRVGQACTVLEEIADRRGASVRGAESRQIGRDRLVEVDRTCFDLLHHEDCDDLLCDRRPAPRQPVAIAAAGLWQETDVSVAVKHAVFRARRNDHIAIETRLFDHRIDALGVEFFRHRRCGKRERKKCGDGADHEVCYSLRLPGFVTATLASAAGMSASS